MALYALGDMHLAFSVDKPMDRFGKVWVKHEEKIAKNCGRMLQDGDTFVITGDHSWGRKLPEAEKDLEFIAKLPGRKILLRGNHDMKGTSRGFAFCRIIITVTGIMRLSGRKDIRLRDHFGSIQGDRLSAGMKKMSGGRRSW